MLALNVPTSKIANFNKMGFDAMFIIDFIMSQLILDQQVPLLVIIISFF